MVRPLDVVDMLALACDLWDCESGKAMEMLDLPKVQDALDWADPDPAAEPGTCYRHPSDVSPTVPRPRPAAVYGARLTFALVRSSAARSLDDTDALATRTLLFVTVRAGLDLRLSFELEQLSSQHRQIALGMLSVEHFAILLDRHLVPGDRLDAEAADATCPLAWPDGDFRDLSHGARRALHVATAECRRLGHPGVNPEHLLVGVAAIPDERGGLVIDVIGHSSLQELQDDLELVIRPGRVPVKAIRRFTAGGWAVLQSARAEARDAGDAAIGTHHLLLAILTGPDTPARRTLSSLADPAELDGALRSTDELVWSERPEEAERRRREPPAVDFDVVPPSFAMRGEANRDRRVCVFCDRSNDFDGERLVGMNGRYACERCLHLAIRHVGSRPRTR